MQNQRLGIYRVVSKVSIEISSSFSNNRKISDFLEIVVVEHPDFTVFTADASIGDADLTNTCAGAAECGGSLLNSVDFGGCNHIGSLHS